MKSQLLSAGCRLPAKGKQAALVLLVAALHGLVLYLVAAQPQAPAPHPPATTAVTVELARISSITETAMSVPTPPPAAESVPQQDTLAPERQLTLPPKPVEQPIVKTPSAKKPVRKRADNPAPHADAKQAETADTAPAVNTAPSLTTAGQTSPASATAAHLNNPAPQYPALALKRKWQGTVHLRVQVLASGRPGEIQIVSSSGRDLLDQAAVAAVRQWSFVAAQQRGVAIESWATFPLSFKLQ